MVQSVVQPWVNELTFMQQAVLFAAIRGPDGIRKDHVAKRLARWLRRCILLSAFDGIVYGVPYDPVGARWRSGSFTGPSCYEAYGFNGELIMPRRFSIHGPSEPPYYNTWQDAMKEVVRLYLKSCDELPHHYQLHFMHAAEIIGYEYYRAHAKIAGGEDNPAATEISNWWFWCYEAIANDMHLSIETAKQMRTRLGDNEKAWREAERGVHADI